MSLNVGMSCEEYSLLVIAGPSSNDLPEVIREKIQRHEEACKYHCSGVWHQSALGIPVTRVMEVAATEVIKKYNSGF